MIIKPDQYIYPPRSADAIPRDQCEIFAAMGWLAQYKYNDTHILIKYCDNGTIEIWNRHAERIKSYHAPDWLIEELVEIGLHEPGSTTILDGGLLDQKHAAIKDTIVIWDILVHNNEHLIGTNYQHRYNIIKTTATNQNWEYHHKSHQPIPFGLKITNNIFIPNNWPAQLWDTAWDNIQTVNQPYTTGSPNSANYDCKPVLEGLIFKDPKGKLEFGFKPKNNDSWIIRSRVRTGRHQF